MTRFSSVRRLCHTLLIIALLPSLANCTSPTPSICIADLCADVRIADTPKKRQQGLMHVTNLGKQEGMLFLFETPDYHSFWMKNTPTPLDIIWISSANQVVHIVKHTTPYSLKALRTPYPADKVLEIHAGLSTSFNITPGDKVTLHNIK